MMVSVNSLHASQLNPFPHDSVKGGPLVDRKVCVFDNSFASINYYIDSSSTMDTHGLGLDNMIVNSLQGGQLEPFPRESTKEVEGEGPHWVVSEDSRFDNSFVFINMESCSTMDTHGLGLDGMMDSMMTLRLSQLLSFPHKADEEEEENEQGGVGSFQI